MTVRRAAQGGDDVGAEMLQVPQPPPPAPPPDEPTTLASVAEDPQGQQQSSACNMNKRRCRAGFADRTLRDMRWMSMWQCAAAHG